MEFMPRIQKVLICSDLDRTIIPNGYQEESALARPALRQLAKHPDIFLAYVSGRDRKLILDAIEEFYLPIPDFAIGDVGTTLYRITDGSWQKSSDWNREIAHDWSGLDWEELAEYLTDVEELRLQEPEKQTQYKLSFYTDRNVDHQQLIEKTHLLLEKQGFRSMIIWSVDEIKAVGLVDIVPACASKLQATQFLMQQERFPEDRTVFAGDSGNDLDALTSGLQAILVKNAAEEVRKEAYGKLSRQQMTNCLYLSKGNFFGMNGNYAAGLLEGLVHFVPETGDLIAKAMEKLYKPTPQDT
jgi:HAD superfamily hydrolase (TIGR01484 family)